MGRNKNLTIGLVSFLIVSAGFAVFDIGRLSAQSSSTNYEINEYFIGPGGQLESSSTNYQLQGGGAGDTGVGESESTNFRQQAGFNTASEPRLSFAITDGAVELGGLSTVTTATDTATFSVLNYTTYGYVVQILGDTPVNGSHNLAAMSSTAASQVGTEQFGINLVANTSPTTFGADPAQVPSSDFSYGQAATNYNTANNYRYVQGETIALAGEASGQTDYTISYITNISETTPGGEYAGGLTLIVVGTY